MIAQSNVILIGLKKERRCLWCAKVKFRKPFAFANNLFQRVCRLSSAGGSRWQSISCHVDLVRP